MSLSTYSRFHDGLVILGPAHTTLLKAIDAIVVGWARDEGAEEISPPPVYRVADLEKFDVYTNFPHLSLVAGPLRVEPVPSPRAGKFVADDVDEPALGLPTATCFGCYLYLEGSQLPADTLMTLANRCFRNEDHFDELRRLMCFQMREIVAVGSYEYTQDVLERYTARIESLGAALSLDLDKLKATDPFFQPEGSRALLQKLSGVKDEFRVDGLAVSSVNTHRNFFGERCDITLPDGSYAHSSCVAFGLERWVTVLVDRHRTANAALAAVHEATAQLEPA